MTTPSLDAVIQRAGEMQPHLPNATSLLIGLAAIGTVTVSGLWVMVQHVGVLAHEGAHAVLGSGMGHKVGGVRVNRDGTGDTALAGPGRGPRIAVGVIGYLGPSLFGLGAAKLIAVGHIILVLWLTLLAMAVMLPLLRTSFGVISAVLTGVLLYLVGRYAPVGAQLAVSYGIAWFLLLAGVRVVLQHGSSAGDAGILQGLTHLPRGFWSSLWLVGTVVAFGIGASLLV